MEVKKNNNRSAYRLRNNVSTNALRFNKMQ